MRKLFATIILTCGLCASANADVWMWIDLNGDMHFVNTSTAIYTWLDEDGYVQFSDTPDHENAVLVDLVWHSKGDDLPDETQTAAAAAPKQSKAWPGETEGERFEREAAEAYYCKRAQEVYNSYLKAPRLYKTLDSGERQYLSDEETAATLTETKARVAELCG
jgi:hypothetical protein